MKRLPRAVTISLLVASLALAAACGSPTRFRQPVTRFEAASAQTAEAFKTSMLAANQVEREVIVNRHSISGEPLGSSATIFLEPTFSLEGIQVRLEALQAIEIFAGRLKAVAESRAAGETADAVGAATTNFNRLADRVVEAARLEADPTRLQSLATPVGALVGLIARISVEQRQEAVLIASIQEAEAAMVAILDLLREDARAFERLQRTAQSEVIATRALQYDMDIESGVLDTETKRRRRLAELDELAARYETTLTGDILAAFNAMEASYKGLVAFARASASDVVFQDLIGSIDNFLLRADIAYDAARRLEEALQAPPVQQ